MRYEHLVVGIALGCLACSTPMQVQSVPCPPDESGTLILNDHCFGQTADQAIYVDWESGSEGNQGGPLDPMRTITAGIAKAQAVGKKVVRISEGMYVETVTLVEGIALEGGFSRKNVWDRNPVSYNVIIQGISTNKGSIGIQGSYILAETKISDVTVWASDAIGNGISTYGLHCFQCDGVYLKRVRIFAGRGSDGQPGEMPQDTPTSNTPDGAGKKGVVGTVNVQNGCTSLSVVPQGGAGGFIWGFPGGGVGGNGGFEGVWPDGSDGSMGSNNPFPPLPGYPFGQAGKGAKGASFAGNEGGHADAAQAGFDGIPGQDGAFGAGAKVSNRFINSNNGAYRVESGQDGQPGELGGGGGGGGGSGRVEIRHIAGNDYFAGHGGGGGGAGGRGGRGGGGGTTGGSSIGILAAFSPLLILEDSEVYASTGGNGGQGGVGKAGGAGGKGAPGVPVQSLCNSVGASGKGGDGGAGGWGGPGGGGAGGLSVALYQYQSEVRVSNTQLIAGVAGKGAPGGRGKNREGNPGEDGLSASVINQ